MRGGRSRVGPLRRSGPLPPAFVIRPLTFQRCGACKGTNRRRDGTFAILLAGARRYNWRHGQRYGHTTNGGQHGQCRRSACGLAAGRKRLLQPDWVPVGERSAGRNIRHHAGTKSLQLASLAGKRRVRRPPCRCRVFLVRGTAPPWPKRQLRQRCDDSARHCGVSPGLIGQVPLVRVAATAGPR